MNAQKSPYTGEPMLTVRDRIDGMPVDVWAMLQNCPSIHHMMTAIQRAGFNGRGEIRVMYEDETEKTMKAPESFLDCPLADLSLLTFASAFSD